MNLRSLSLAAPAIALAVMANAPVLADPRIANHFYQPSEVVTVRGGTGIQSTIAFAPDEQIQNVAVGDSATWQVTPNKQANLLFVKPMNAKARTNMTVVTDQRTYLFDLVSAPRPATIYMLRFTYPAPPRPAPAVAPAVAVADPPVPPAPEPPDPTTLNFAWTSRGDKVLIPSRAFDDGHSTYLAWPKEAALPAILVREADGTEGPVNYTARGDCIVVEGVPAQLVLRSGKQMATLTPSPRPAVQPKPAGERTAMNHEPPSRPFAHVADARP